VENDVLVGGLTEVVEFFGFILLKQKFGQTPKGVSTAAGDVKGLPGRCVTLLG
jgi:hypothetical protein